MVSITMRSEEAASGRFRRLQKPEGIAKKPQIPVPMAQIGKGEDNGRKKVNRVSQYCEKL